MEIFRTDGSGKSYSNKRLFDLVSLVGEYTEDDFFINIKSINDHKGLLVIEINDLVNVEYTFSVFQTFWHTFNEYCIELRFNNQIIKEV